MYEGRAFLTHKGWDNLENYWYQTKGLLPGHRLREISADVRIDLGNPTE